MTPEPRPSPLTDPGPSIPTSSTPRPPRGRPHGAAGPGLGQAGAGPGEAAAGPGPEEGDPRLPGAALAASELPETRCCRSAAAAAARREVGAEAEHGPARHVPPPGCGTPAAAEPLSGRRGAAAGPDHGASEYRDALGAQPQVGGFLCWCRSIPSPAACVTCAELGCCGRVSREGPLPVARRSGHPALRPAAYCASNGRELGAGRVPGSGRPSPPPPPPLGKAVAILHVELFTAP